MSEQKIYEKLIRTFPDYPKKGINFIDWMPVLGSPEALQVLTEDLANLVKGRHFTKLAALETRGYLIGLPLAKLLGLGFVPIRKKGKLPGPCMRQEYALEYGTDAIEIQEDAITSSDSVLVVDDLLATGGTMGAANKMIARKTNDIVDLFFIELEDLKGSKSLEYPYFSLIKRKEK